MPDVTPMEPDLERGGWKCPRCRRTVTDGVVIREAEICAFCANDWEHIINPGAEGAHRNANAPPWTGLVLLGGFVAIAVGCMVLALSEWEYGVLAQAAAEYRALAQAAAVAAGMVLIGLLVYAARRMERYERRRWRAFLTRQGQWYRFDDSRAFPKRRREKSG